MEILLMLLPISFVLVGIAVAIFTWAVNHNQFEDLDRHALEVLDESEQKKPTGETNHE